MSVKTVSFNATLKALLKTLVRVRSSLQELALDGKLSEEEIFTWSLALVQKDLKINKATVKRWTVERYGLDNQTPR